MHFRNKMMSFYPEEVSVKLTLSMPGDGPSDMSLRLLSDQSGVPSKTKYEMAAEQIKMQESQGEERYEIPLVNTACCLKDDRLFSPCCKPFNRQFSQERI